MKMSLCSLVNDSCFSYTLKKKTKTVADRIVALFNQTARVYCKCVKMKIPTLLLKAKSLCQERGAQI